MGRKYIFFTIIKNSLKGLFRFTSLLFMFAFLKFLEKLNLLFYQKKKIKRVFHIFSHKFSPGIIFITIFCYKLNTQKFIHANYLKLSYTSKQQYVTYCIGKSVKTILQQTLVDHAIKVNLLY